jgi:sugar phosphate isomerase/epimerase
MNRSFSLDWSRRSFLAAASLAMASPAFAKQKTTVGLELYSVRNELKADLFGTVSAVAKMGYQGVEFFSPYYQWTTDYAKDVRKHLDSLGIVCLSTHNGPNAFDVENYQKTIDLNGILGSKLAVMASAGKVVGPDGWKSVADKLTAASGAFAKAKMRSGFHNHQIEFKPLDNGQKPMEILAKNTPKNVVLQLDIGTCVHSGNDPVAWIKANPGRFASIHCKDFSKNPDKGYKVILGEGDSPWKEIIAAAEKSGGIEHWIIEQEASSSPMDAVKQCLDSFQKLRA